MWHEQRQEAESIAQCRHGSDGRSFGDLIDIIGLIGMIEIGIHQAGNERDDLTETDDR